MIYQDSTWHHWTWCIACSKALVAVLCLAPALDAWGSTPCRLCNDVLGRPGELGQGKIASGAHVAGVR